MKTYFTYIAVLLISFTTFAQQGINYKAVLKDSNGNLLSDTFMNVQFTIHQGTANGTIVYQEDHNYTTDANGLLILNIGTDTNPSIGVFTGIDWSSDLHFLQTSITYSGGTIDFDATEFMAVPYALNAANVTGLERITEGSNSGWRLIGADPTNFGPIGSQAIDLSINDSDLGPRGATGDLSTALGSQTIATGAGSFATGVGSEASGLVSTTLGYSTIASGVGSVAVGNSNIDVPTAAFVVGNGDFNVGEPIRSNALEVYQDGQVIAPSSSLVEITDPKALVTKEYSDALASTGLEAINEGNGVGWRLIGRDPTNYGTIGEEAIDLSSIAPLGLGGLPTNQGALGNKSVVMGTNLVASGDNQVVVGFQNEEDPSACFIVGSGYDSPAGTNRVNSLVVYNNNFDPRSVFNTKLTVNGSTTLNGFTSVNSSIQFNGNSIKAPNIEIADITSNKDLVTKEYVDYNFLSSGGNIVTNNVGIGRLNPSSLFEVYHDDGPPTFANRTNAFSIRNELGPSWQMYVSNGNFLYLYNNGNFRGLFDGASGTYTQTSDRKAKKNIVPLEERTLDKVLQLNPVSYLMKDQKDNERHMGLISQEVQEVFPSITHYVEEHDLLALSYTELIPILIKALQEQQGVIDGQNEKIGVQNSKIEQFETSITNLMKRIKRLEVINE